MAPILSAICFFLIPQFWSSPKAAVEFHPNLTWALFRSPGFDRQHWSSATCQVRYRLEIPSCNILYILIMMAGVYLLLAVRKYDLEFIYL